MKCPKCEYLGFDTGDRCRNCGYDFSLMAASAPEPAGELSLQTTGDETTGTEWLEDLDTVLGGSRGAAPLDTSLTPDLAFTLETPTAIERAAPPVPSSPAASPTIAAPPAMTAPVPAVSAPTVVASVAPSGAAAAPALAALAFEPTLPPPSFRGEPALPLFSGDPSTDDEPMIKVPSAPRAPLAVRRTPETPRLRAVPRLVERPAPEPALDFAEEAAAVAAGAATSSSARRLAPAQTSTAGARLGAAAIDHAILFAIDAVVVYLTLRIAQLNLADIRQLSILPMGAFLGLLKLAYFTAFTCVGGQTIGKMAMGIRVVNDEQHLLDAPQAIHRALAGAVSFLTLGAGFVPALVGADRRALHDRLAHTRVVALPSA
jgi:uncharacterized RDD family membrane protein YckC